ncbi:MAG: hypothetical protein ACR2LS_01295 [Thermomicrobiales bacterium]
MTENHQQQLLHVTNGDIVAGKITQAGLGEHVLPWRDVLSEGPVPAKLSLINLAHRRSKFIEAAGWAPYRETRQAMAERDSELLRFKDYDGVVFWFEHDLTDQLQMLQALERFATRGDEGTPMWLVTTDRFPDVDRFVGIGQLRPDQLPELYAQRRELVHEDFRAARRAWEVFRSPDPRIIEEVLLEDTSRFPYLASALRRHVEQFPGADDGLSGTERDILTLLSEQPREAGALFAAAQAREDAPFLSDLAFQLHVDRLMSGARPLVQAGDDADSSDNLGLELTARGKAVLSGSETYADADYPARWLGGVEMNPVTVPWRWDRAASRIISAESGD